MANILFFKAVFCDLRHGPQPPRNINSQKSGQCPAIIGNFLASSTLSSTPSRRPQVRLLPTKPNTPPLRPHQTPKRPSGEETEASPGQTTRGAPAPQTPTQPLLPRRTLGPTQSTDRALLEVLPGSDDGFLIRPGVFAPRRLLSPGLPREKGCLPLGEEIAKAATPLRAPRSGCAGAPEARWPPRGASSQASPVFSKG